MKLLLDSHAFLWWLAEDPKLSAEARQAIADPASMVHVSAATIWELSIKAASGTWISTAPTWWKRSKKTILSSFP